MKGHMKRLASPNTWPIKRKGLVFITRPKSGTHKFDFGMPISVILTEVLKVAKNRREAEHILNAGHVKVDGTIRKDHKFIVGLIKPYNFRFLK